MVFDERAGQYFASFTRVLLSVGHDANHPNLLLKGRPFRMRLHQLTGKADNTAHDANSGLAAHLLGHHAFPAVRSALAESFTIFFRSRQK